MDTSRTDRPSTVHSTNRLKSQLCFAVFVFLLVCSITLTIVFFIFAIFNITFVYVGIGCLAGDLFIIAVYFIFLRCCRPNRRRRQQQRSDLSATENSSVNNMATTPVSHVTEYRRLEREMQLLTTEINDLQATSLCNAADLDQARHVLRRDHLLVNEWIEGIKVPDSREIQQIARTLRRLSARLQAIRERSNRISASLAARACSARPPAFTSTSGHVTYPPPPPTYDDSCRSPPPDRFNNTYTATRSQQNMSRSFSTLSTRRSAPPTYEDAIGTPV